MSSFSKFYEAIDEIESNLRRDLIGPIKDDEYLEREDPMNRYSIGLLWPKSTKKLDSTKALLGNCDYTEEIESYNEAVDDSIRDTNEFKPCAMGISCIVSKETKIIDVNFSYGKYNHQEETDGEFIINNYKREQIDVNVSFKISDYIGRVEMIDGRDRLSNNIEIICNTRKIFNNKSKLVTISVVNNNKAKSSTVEISTNSIFQCELELNCNEGFLPIYNDDLITDDNELLINEMLYDGTYNYAYGHGCSTKYSDVLGSVYSIKSEFMPSQEVLQMMPNKLNNDKFLTMKYWRNIDRKSGCSELYELVREYKTWFDNIAKNKKKLDNHIKAYEITIEKIEICIKRLEQGVDVLRKNDVAWESFKLMNEAMLLQRVKSKNVNEDTIRWYPFQLAYVLQIIPDIVNKESEFRDYVDLLWFPTGGGKTEAYLGVCAFTIFYRRLLNKIESDGVAIIMRYTLRLLTIQQFERATALICACEHLRKTHKINGGEINIGLWIGSNMTPNNLKDAEKKLTEIKEKPNGKIYEGNPMQFKKCPWCGSVIDVGCYSIDGYMKIRCNNNLNCDFNEGLPIYLVDEDIYDKKPTLVLSTVDKFARIVWEEKSKAIFGLDNNLPPELIIQDELHLISGPLGSITGVYEIAVDKLCERGNKRPKIIASTATVRNATQQIKNLYNRKMFQFPPNGVSADDSFFAVRAIKDDRPARRYIGLCEQGGSVADLLIKVYSNLIFTRYLFIKKNMPVDVIDQYFTIVGYFNAIKDLGASSSIINDRASTNIKALVNHKFKEEAIMYGLNTDEIKNYEKNDELTSRKTSKEIKDTLEQLEKSYLSDLCYSYVLASNMLSVGIDINRLGVMTVYNQPKSNAEYIQATSRVGRSNPGVVLTLYNSRRSRDKSHYEQFPFYHKTFYKYVESTSVTPFSARAIEKALHGVFIALIRHTVKNMGKNDQAVNFEQKSREVKAIKEYMLSRIKNINDLTLEYAEQYIEDIIDKWGDLAENSSGKFLYARYDGELCLLNSAEKENTGDFPPVLNALRNVDASCNIYIKSRRD